MEMLPKGLHWRCALFQHETGKIMNTGWRICHAEHSNRKAFSVAIHVGDTAGWAPIAFARHNTDFTRVGPRQQQR